MSKTVVLIDHPVGQRDDRASKMIVERGYEVVWCCPGRGEPLPSPDAGFAAAVVYGGAENLSEIHERCYLHDEIDWIQRWAGDGRRLLGICLGSQLLARALGARVRKHPDGLHEIGYYPVAPTEDGRASGFLEDTMHVYHWHQEGFELPQGAVRLATGEDFENQAFRVGEAVYGLQFHPEIPPRVFTRWIREAGHMLEAPGAHSKERQLEDGERHDPVMRDWFDGFLDRWLGPAS